MVNMYRRDMGGLPHQRGFTFLAVLAAMLLLALGSQKVVTVLAQEDQRERELLLLRTGAAVRTAIGDYYESSPGSAKQWPQSLEVLLDDQRSVVLRRHLRRLDRDPITRSADWGIVRAPDGGIAGIYSLSEARPIRTGGPELELHGVRPAQSYREWRFVYEPKPDDERGRNS
ncbi:MAG: type II secretion system protein [Hydrogenophaga sp.]|jgi:type II secretory pathway pseudopilin PulG|nr:type II secretion system protein [Hydrogenophaga sp.]